jgi:hypothetical protein
LTWLGVLDPPRVSVEEFLPAGDDLLRLVHEPAYTEAEAL